MKYEKKYDNLIVLPVHAAIRAKDEAATLALVQSGAVDVDAVDQDGRNALLFAAMCGSSETVVDRLLARTTDVDARDKYGWTALILAARDGQATVCSALIGAGADVQAQDEDGRTALDNAITCNHTACIDLLRQHGGQTKAELS